MALSTSSKFSSIFSCYCRFTAHRSFSTTPSNSISVEQQIAESSRRKPKNLPIIPYPYGDRQWYKQSNKGLYGGLTVGFGNRVSEKNEIKTRRKWRPNIQNKRLYSKALDRSIKVRVATRVLRTIDKLGGLDEYLLGDKPARIKELGPAGWMLRWRIIQTETVQERFRQERVALGLPEMGIGELGLVDILGQPATAEQVEEEVRQFDEALDEAETLDDAETIEASSTEYDADQSVEQAEEEEPVLMREEPVKEKPARQPLLGNLFGSKKSGD